MKTFIFDPHEGKLKKVKAKEIIYRDIAIHLRKDYVYYGDKTKQWILTECSSGALFAAHNSIKECFFFADLLIESYGYKNINRIIKETKAKQFDNMVRKFI